MALLVEKGVFTKTTSTSTPVSQQVNLNNGSLTPKFIILWTNGLTTDGTYTENIVWSYGFTDLTNYACQTMTALDNSTTQNESYSWNNNCLISICTPTGTPAQVSRATVSSVAAGSFTLSWTVQSDTNATVIHYIVGGGDDITNVSAVSTTVGDINTGSHSYTGTGTSFLPNFALTMTGTCTASALSANTLAVGLDYATLNIGAARTTSEQFCMSGRTETIGTADTDMDLHNNACLLGLNTTDGTEQFLADFTQFDDAAGGGITVNVSNGAPAAGVYLGFLFVKTTSQTAFEVGTFQQRSGTGTQDVSFTNTALDPELVFLAGINSATVNASVVNNYLCIGAADGTRQGCTWCGDQNAASNMINTSVNLTSQVYRQATPNATASSSTTNAQCTMNDMATPGMFQLSWGTADTTLRRMAYWTVGTQPLFVSQTSIQKYDIIATVTSTSIHKYHMGDLVTACKVGTITKDTTTGAHTQNFTNELGFRPAAMLFWVTLRTTTGLAAHVSEGVGFSDGTNNFSIATSQEDNTLNSDGQCRSSSNGSVLLIDQTSANVFFEAKPIFGDNGFDLEYLSAANSTQYKISYIAWGANALQASVTSQTHAGTGSRDYTNVGFQGDIAIFLGNSMAANAGQSGSVDFGIGAATSSSNQWAITFDSNTGFPTDTSRSQVTDKCLRVHEQGGAGSFITDAAFTQFLSNGYRLNYTSAATADVFGALVMKGGFWDVGAFNQATSNGTQQVSITADRTPIGVLLSSFGNAASGSVQAEIRFSLGSSDVTSNTSTWVGALDAVDGTQRKNDSDFSDTKCIRTITPGVTPAMTTEAHMESFEDASFTINNTTTDGTARQICYLCFSEESIGTTPVSETSIHKYDITGNALQTSIHKYNLAAYIAQTSIHKYNILNDILQSSIHKYNILANALQTSIHKYDIIANILQNSIHKYDILNFVDNTSVHKYSLLQNILQTSIHKYHLFQNALQASIHKYDLLQNILQNNIHKYNLTHYVKAGKAKLVIHIPLYIYPFHWVENNEWEQVADLVAAYPDVEFILKVNPESGPGSSQNSDFTTGFGILSAGNNPLHMKIIGYVYTSYGSRPIADVKTDIDRYVSWYGQYIRGIFLDEMEDDTGDEAYYSEITAYCHERNLFTWGNPGKNIAESYVSGNTLDIFQISETDGYPTSETISNNTFNGTYPTSKFAVGIYNASSYNTSLLEDFATKAQYLFVTSDIGPNPYDTVSQYIDDLAVHSGRLLGSIHKYDILNTIAQTTIHKYHLLQNVIETSIHKYDLEGLVFVLQSSIHKYDILNTILQTNIHKYNILQNIAQTSVHKYNILVNVLQSSLHKYHLFHDIVQSSIQKYDILQNVIQSSLHKYHLIANVLQSSIHKYDLLANILQSSIHKYNIEVLGAVLQSSIQKYDILVNAVQSSIHKYNILNNVAQTSVHKYNLLQDIVQNSIQKYNILVNVLQSSLHKYDLLQDILQTSIHKYDILAEALTVLQSSIHKYDILQHVAQTSIHKYNIIAQILQNSIQKYNILQNILQNTIHKYHMGGRVGPIESIHRYAIEVLYPEIFSSRMMGGLKKSVIPRLRQIRYPVYHVTEQERFTRRKQLRDTIKPVIIPAFSDQINRVVSPFVITNPAQNTVRVRFAVSRKEPVFFAAIKSVPVQIAAKTRKNEANRAHSAHIMQQKAIEKYGKRLHKLQKIMTLFFLHEQLPDDK